MLFIKDPFTIGCCWESPRIQVNFMPAVDKSNSSTGNKLGAINVVVGKLSTGRDW